MPPPSQFSAVVLAGGRSARMGREKALLDGGGTGEGPPLWRRQRDLLRAAGAAEVFLSVREEQEWRHTADGFSAQLLDAISVGGPIIGLTAGLERASHAHLAVLAVDLPRMSVEWFTTLQAECSEGVGCIGRRRDEGTFFEPLAAIYPKALMTTAWEALVKGEFSLQRFVASAVAEGRMRVHDINDSEAPLFENWNTPADRPPQA